MSADRGTALHKITAKAPHRPAAAVLGTISGWLPGTRRDLRPYRLLGCLLDTEWSGPLWSVLLLQPPAQLRSRSHCRLAKGP